MSNAPCTNLARVAYDCENSVSQTLLRESTQEESNLSITMPHLKEGALGLSTFLFWRILTVFQSWG